jgi:hypothetical protein
MLKYSRKETSMAHKKLDAIIETVRYTPGGKISVVRAYQRHGAAWSDHVLLDREQLVGKLKNGKNIVTGVRKAYLGGVFKTGTTVRCIDGHVVTEGQSAIRDLLAGVPLF